MTHPVRIENDVLRLEVWPKLGGKVSSVVDKTDGFELLFNFPAEIPEDSMYGRPYENTWYAGWDECFPAVGVGHYVGHPYDQIPIPDHGEVYAIPTTSVPVKDGITSVWHGLRFGYRLTRRLTLTSEGLRAAYSLTNLAPFEFRFVWAQHALMSMDSPVEFELPSGSPMRWSHSPGKDVQQPFTWPRISDQIDLSTSDRLPSNGGWKVFALEPIRSAATIRYPKRGRKLQMRYQGAGLEAFWGLWINTGAWNHQRHFAMEPTTGRFDQLDRAVQDGSAGRVGPGASIEWQVDWIVGGL
ncbi:MAG: DUF5107 domain-containing protein [Phycisphaerae bacterium]|nr:DUF5107 domain-containing protein [Phycisphaerae bacterium]MDW8262304.1 DUF5107 domain-containing protein [Phycisphaerales bacterium]